MKKASAVLLAAAGLVVFGCSHPEHKTITLAGSTAFQPFAEKLAEHYMAAHKDVRINVQGGGSAVGIQSALSGSAEIGMADLLKLPDEAASLNSVTVARDGIGIVVNPKNSIVNLTKQQAHDIFAGKITNWKEIGGIDSPIRVISREEGSGTRRSFDKLVLGEDKLSASALFQNSNGTIREAVASDANAIGYVSIGLINERVKGVSYEGVAPNNDNVKKGIYPLARPVFFLTKASLNQQTQDFIAYVLSKEAQDILEKEGLIAVK
ncbi:MAG: phosphate ABC transporter substrate-binding protein [Deltaproteobacteria bacterium]|nr:phosphate ABC transporter substrate-binding protein [Deltaproteobacteria bacterium]MBI2974565.1 phosphate ABC transporter substrate-binding protein [Deltaproteobacteria bacterium]